MKFSPFLFILMVLLLPGCAAKKFAVKNADHLLTYQITRRVPLYSKQKAELTRDVENFLNNTKPEAQEMLPLIDEVNLEKSAQVEAQYRKFETYYQSLAKKFSTVVAKHMAKLDEKQQKDFFNNLDDENREILKKEKEKQIDQIEERLEMILGSISGEQKQIIRDYSDYYRTRSKERLDRRLALHQSFKTIYQQDLSPDSRQELIEESFAKYQTETLANTKNIEILKKFIPTVSNKQKEYFRKQIKDVKSLVKYFISTEY
jgi:hypothetical protein